MGMALKSSPSQHTHLQFLRCLDWKIKARIKENIKWGRFGWLETSQEVVTRQRAVTTTEKPPGEMGTNPQAALFHRSGILRGIFTDVRCTGKPREKYAKVLTLKCRPFLLSSTLPRLHTQDLFVQDFPESLNKAGFLLQVASAGPARLSINVSWF